MELEHKQATYREPLFLKFENTQIPEFIEVRSKDWIYYGERNLWPDYIIELYQRSAKHNAIINGKVNYIIGGGFKPTTNPWIEKVNNYENLKDLTQKLSYDLEMFNGFAIEVIYGINGKVSEMYHVDFSKIRTNKDETLYFYSENWNDASQLKEESKHCIYPAFDFSTPTGKQLYVYTIKTPRKTGEPNVYPVPEYMGALSAIETDIEISNFHLTNIKTGFSAGTMVNLLNGTPTEEEAKKLEKKFKEKFTGTDKAGSLILNFAIDKEHAAEVVHMQPSDMDKQYLQMSDRVNQEIFTGHKVTSPTLFGVMTAGALGQRNEMLDAYELFQATYITPRQIIIEDTFNKIAGLNGMPEDIEINKSKPLHMVIPDSKIIEALTTDEARELMGLEALEKPVKDESAKVIESINTLSPLVANNVLASMTPNEIRALVSLAPIAGGDVIKDPVAQAQFNSQSDEKLIQLFSERGVDKNEWDIIKRKKVMFTTEKDIFNAEIEGLTDIMQFRVYSPLELKVLALLDKDNLMPSEEIAKALEIKQEQVKGILKRLINDNILNRSKEIIEREKIVIHEPTAKGEKVIDKQPSEILDFKVMYSYDWRKGFNNSDLPSSRPFCTKLIELNRLYTRAEIETIGDTVGYNVWLHRGGFYREPGTETTLPYCRHQWEQVIVTKKAK